jgi:hypothetical protein
MAFSLFWEFGYLLKCGVTGHGDGMALISGLTPAWLWRAVIFIAGLALFRAAISVTSSELHFIMDADAPQWRSRLIRMLWIVYIASGLIACAGPLFDPRDRLEMLNSGALTSFASSVGLIAVPLLFPSCPRRNLDTKTFIQRSMPLILFALAVSVFLSRCSVRASESRFSCRSGNLPFKKHLFHLCKTLILFVESQHFVQEPAFTGSKSRQYTRHPCVNTPVSRWFRGLPGPEELCCLANTGA